MQNFPSLVFPVWFSQFGYLYTLAKFVSGVDESKERPYCQIAAQFGSPPLLTLPDEAFVRDLESRLSMLVLAALSEGEGSLTCEVSFDDIEEFWTVSCPEL